MSNEAVEATGATVEEAIDRALEILGATDDEVEVQIIADVQAGGFLRRGAQARVRVKRRDERTPEDLALDEEGLTLDEEGLALDEEEEGEYLPGPELEAQALAAHDFLQGLVDAMGIEADVEAVASRSTAIVSMSGPEMGLLIGRRGATLEALQDITRAAVQLRVGQRAWVNVDIEGYRARQKEILERRARSVAARVRRSGKPEALEPMTSFERKVVHDALSRFDGVTTLSEGEEPNRLVVVNPA